MIESRNIMSWNNQGCILTDIASGLFSTSFDDEAAEATEIDLLPSR